jgi:hypothetical protein
MFRRISSLSFFGSRFKCAVLPHWQISRCKFTFFALKQQHFEILFEGMLPFFTALLPDDTFCSPVFRIFEVNLQDTSVRFEKY